MIAPPMITYVTGLAPAFWRRSDCTHLFICVEPPSPVLSLPTVSINRAIRSMCTPKSGAKAYGAGLALQTIAAIANLVAIL